MDFFNAPLDFSRNSLARKRETVDRAAVDLLGSEPLEGSGFEKETPAPEFEYDWRPAEDQIKGVLSNDTRKPRERIPYQRTKSNP